MKTYCCLLAILFYAGRSDAQLNIDSLQQVLKRTPVTASNLQHYVDRLQVFDRNEIESIQFIGDWVIKNSGVDSLLTIYADIHCIMGKIYLDISDYEKAAQYLTVAQEIAENNHFPTIQAKALNWLAALYYINAQIEKAIEYYKKTIDISQRYNYVKGLGVAKYNLGGMYMETGSRNPDTIRISFRLMWDGFNVVKQLKDTQNMILFSNGLCQSYLKINRNDSALLMVNYTEQLLQSSGNEQAYINHYLRVAEVYNASNNYSEAISYYKKGLALALKYNRPRLVYNYHEGLAESFEMMGDYKNANLHNKLYIKVHDSLVSTENFAKAADFQNRYERAKKNNEILRLHSAYDQKAWQNKIFIAATIGLLLFGFLGYNHIKNRNKIAMQREELYRQKIADLEKDKQLLAIDAMLKGQEEERSRIAKDLHDGLGCLLSGTKLSLLNIKERIALAPETMVLFEKSLSMLDNSIGDLRKVAHNLMPESLVKFGLFDALHNFCSAIQFSSEISIQYNHFGPSRKLGSTTEIFIYRIIQELVNNAIKHADPQKILVQITCSNGKIHIEVEDDGGGFDVKKASDVKGSGLTNVRYRVNYLNGNINITSNPGHGTSINIELKI